MKKLVIGVTGPAASGKNEVCAVFRKKGALVVDADKIGHEAIMKSSKAYKRLVSSFGDGILRGNGEIDRKMLASIVFSDPSKLKMLNKITHPAIYSSIKRQVMSAKRPVVVINAALLKEIGLVTLTDKVLVVMSGKALRLRRLVKVRKMPARQAESMIRSQMKDAGYLRLADMVIKNSSSLKKLKKEADRAFEKITASSV